MAPLFGGQPVSTPPALPDELPALSATSAKQAGEAVLRWFGAHDTLTRQEFLKLVEQATDAAPELARV